MVKKCIVCGKEFKTHLSEFNRRKSCSRSCSGIYLFRGKPKTMEHRMRIGYAHLGKKRAPFSAEWRKNLSKARKGKKFTKEHCRSISLAQQMEKGNNWKGGKIIGSGGYVLIKNHNHPFAEKTGYVRRSHLVMEKFLGRYILPGEIIHHKGAKYPVDSTENKQDDRPENLQVFPNVEEHRKLHHLLKTQ